MNAVVKQIPGFAAVFTPLANAKLGGLANVTEIPGFVAVLSAAKIGEGLANVETELPAFKAVFILLGIAYTTWTVASVQLFDFPPICNVDGAWCNVSRGLPELDVSRFSSLIFLLASSGPFCLLASLLPRDEPPP